MSKIINVQKKRIEYFNILKKEVNNASDIKDLKQIINKLIDLI